MKKIISILILGLFISCNKPSDKYVDSPTRFVITGMQGDNSLQQMSIYEVEVIDGNYFSHRDGNNLSFRFTDSVNKFKLGDIINFERKNIIE